MTPTTDEVLDVELMIYEQAARNTASYLAMCQRRTDKAAEELLKMTNLLERIYAKQSQT